MRKWYSSSDSILKRYISILKRYISILKRYLFEYSAFSFISLVPLATEQDFDFQN